MMRDWLKVVNDAYEFIGANHPDADLEDKLHDVIDQMERTARWLLPDWRTLEKPIMTLDFDGVISQYKHGWRGVEVIEDEKPVPGAIAFIEDAVKHFTVLIFSSRCNTNSGQVAIDKFMNIYGLSEQARKQLIYQPGKPSAFVMIDDRAWRFDARDGFYDPQHIKDTFKPWYYDMPGWREAKEHTHTCPHGFEESNDCPNCRH